jgi:riboflavin synthase
MFTGIVQTVGSVSSIEARADGLRLWIEAGGLAVAEIALGDSICVDGVCLTVAAKQGQRLCFDLSAETLARTRFGQAREAQRVNLEQALRLCDRLGGHLVTGHVDGIGTVSGMESPAAGRRLRVRVPEGLAKYMAEKGSVTMDGVSLTINSATDNEIGLTLIPHTLTVTNLDTLAPGSRVHVEVDILARYVARLLESGAVTELHS